MPDVQKENKEKGNYVNEKLKTVELGAVSPYVFVSGVEWTAKELKRHAENVVLAKLMNAGHACAGPQIIVVDKQWPQAEELVDLIREELKNAPNRRVYYPGVAKRTLNYLEHLPSSEIFNEDREEDELKIIFTRDVDADGSDYACTVEAFGPYIGVKWINGNNNTEEFLEKTIDFCNDEVFGSLSMSIMIHPKSIESLGQKKYDSVLNRLRWGSIGINIWAGVVVGVPLLRWGAYLDEHPDTDIQSGKGESGNMRCVENVTKSVLTGKFYDPMGASPPTGGKVYEVFSRFSVHRTVPKLLRVVVAFLTGY